MPAVKDAHTLCVTFQLPSLLKAYRKKADEYLSHLVGHEGRGSLFSLLKVSVSTHWRLGVRNMMMSRMYCAIGLNSCRLLLACGW
jgi:nardilysin